MMGLYGVKLRDGTWWLDTNLEPMCGQRSTVFRKLARDRETAEFAEKLEGARVIPAERTVVLAERKDKRLCPTAARVAAKGG